MGYTAGNLELSLTAINDKAIKSIADVAKELSSLSSVLKSVTTTDMKWINSFGTKMKNLSKKLIDIDWSSVDNGFNRLTMSITPFIDKVNSAQASLTAMYGVLQKVSGKKFGNIMNVASGGGKSNGISNLFNFGKFAGAIYLARRMGQAVANIVQYGTDFTETLNLWQVSMRENLDQADEFIQKMNKAYSISQKTLMNAQAIFKNMIGTLGEISDTTAYQLSESILQMALDFSSLYNTTFENAITKFQAVLAGQVRPIRSVSGFDVTETTIYQLYQQLGGTKTMRQLTQVEKRLLRILAVFQQMQRSGAVGDLSKTLDNFANQSRMMTENFKELKTYVGLFFQDLLQSWGVLKYINAGLIFVTEIVKALTKYEAPNFIEGMFDSTVAENEALDELQGKLLDFDKFRALDSTSATSDLAIDQTILDAVSDYQSILANVNNQARELATKWLKDIGLLTKDENGELVISQERLNQIQTILTSIAELLPVIIGTAIVTKIGKVISAIDGATLSIKAFSAITTITLYGGIFLIIYALNDLIKNWDDMSTGAKVAKIAILAVGVALTTFSVLSKIATASTTAFTTALILQKIAAVGLAVGGIGLLIANISLLAGSWDKMETWEKVVGIFGAIGGAALAAAAAIAAFQGAWTLGTGAVAIIGALAAISAAFISFKASTRELSVPKYAVGASNIDSGTLFVAGEAGKTEAVYTGSNGKTNVANVQQMKAAFYQALVEYGESHKDNQPIVVTLDGEVIYRNTTAQAKRRGQHWSNK